MVVDTSALMAILLDEPQAAACMTALGQEDAPVMSAGTAAEALIVAGRRGIGAEMARLIEGLGIEIVAVGAADSHRIAAAYETWGRGLHEAALNFGDCFAYALAKALGAPLLFVGGDFTATDIVPALPV